MSTEAWISLAVIVAIFVGMQRRGGASADLLFLGGVMVLVLMGVLTPNDALIGFSNPAVVVIAALFVIAAGLRSTGVLDWLGHRLLGSSRTESSAMIRLAAFETGLSAFIANTPLVALLVPVVVDWCRQRAISPSRLLIPVSYLAVLGGVCSLIGTSTNLVVQGLLKAEHDQAVIAASAAPQLGDSIAMFRASPAFVEQLQEMSLFEIGKVGIPCALVGSTFLLLFARRILPNRTDMIEKLGEQRREYLVEMLVQPGCRLIGQTVEAAGLRHLQGLFLIEIDRDGDLITPVTPTDTIRAEDRLIFTGVVTTIMDLEKIPGLVPAADMTYEVSPKKRVGRHLTEVVLSTTSPLIGTTIRAANFRQLYNAAVVAVHRNGKRVTNKIGDIRLRPGDTLLLQTRTEFVDSYRNSQDFSLISRVEGSRARRHDRAWLASLLFVVLIGWLSFEGSGDLLPDHLTNPAIAAVSIACLMVSTRCLPLAEARNAIDWQVVFTIGGALALGRAMTTSGAAKYLAEALVSAAGPENPYLLLIVVYVLALLLTEMLSNSAVAVLMFPLVVAMAAAGGYNPRPFIMGITLAASLSFLTPIGYQTNLMVMGPGGYRPSDYFRVGLPLTLLVTITALLLIPLMWPFSLH
jgi:di/tricarboxylate transporter